MLKSGKTILLLILMGAVLLSAQVLAAWPAPAGLGVLYYPVSGMLSGDDIANRTVFLYKDNINIRLQTQTDSIGGFVFNVCDLYTYQGVNILFDGTTAYKLEVPRIDGHITGADAVNIVLDTRAGFMNGQDLALVAGGGTDLNLTLSSTGLDPVTGAINVLHASTGVGGSNQSIPLAWSNPPAGTIYYALSMVDTTPRYDNFIHWLATNIPADTTSLAANASAAIDGMPRGSVQLNNMGTDGLGYFGPEPLAEEPHTYQITIYALRAPLDFGGEINVSWTRFSTAVMDVLLGTASIIGNYTYTPTGIEVPEGTVPLTIARRPGGNSLNINWNQALYPDIVIYTQTGNGSGQYNNATGWTVPPGTPSDGEYVDAGQVGAGDPEKYYKALITGNIPNNTHPAGGTYISQARAVGKVNIPLDGEASSAGKNLISLPFQPSNNDCSLASVFGEGAGAPWSEGDQIQKKIAASPAYLTAKYKNNQWVDVNTERTPPPFEFDPAFGNYVIVKNPKIFTAVGNVIYSDASIACWGAPDAAREIWGKTFMGMVYPVSLGLAAVNLNTVGQTGDLIQYKIGGIGQAYHTAKLAGGVWVDVQTGTPGAINENLATLRLPNSYVYVRKNASGITWNRSFPAE